MSPLNTLYSRWVAYSTPRRLAGLPYMDYQAYRNYFTPANHVK